MSKPISTSFSGAIGVIETKIAALEKASNLAAEALEVRLHSMNEFRSQLKDQAASFVRREEHEHAQLSRQVKNISAFTPDRKEKTLRAFFIAPFTAAPVPWER